MTPIADMIRRMVERKVPIEAIIVAVETYEFETTERAAERREKNRIRQQNHRSRVRDTRDVTPVTVTSVTERDSGKKEKSPTPPKEKTTSQGSKEEPFEAGEPAGEDPQAKLFREGKGILETFGLPERRTGALIGRWLKQRNDPIGLLAAIQYARDQNVAEPIAYISTLVNGKSNGHRNSFASTADNLLARAKEFEIAAGISQPDAQTNGSVIDLEASDWSVSEPQIRST